MLKICGPSTYKPLEIVFNKLTEISVFPSESKESNIASINKKDHKQILKKYLLVSLVLFVIKFLMFSEMFEFFVENKLISSSQSDFKPRDSFINQLLSITHEIYSSFDECLEVRSVLLDISKAFDKVWHDDIFFKLTQNGISENLLNLLHDFLNERKQRVVLNGQSST